MVFLNLTEYSIDYYVLTKLRVIIMKMFLKLNFECQLIDIDILAFGPITEFLYMKPTFDIAFNTEKPPEVSSEIPYYTANGGFWHAFPTEGVIHFCNLWIQWNKRDSKHHDQELLNSHFQSLDCQYQQNSTWNCRVSSKSFKFHIFDNYLLYNLLDLMSNHEKARKGPTKRKIVPSLFHLVGLAGERKIKYCKMYHLNFYLSEEKRCSNEPIQTWNNLWLHSYNKSGFPKMRFGNRWKRKQSVLVSGQPLDKNSMFFHTITHWVDSFSLMEAT